MTEMPQNTEMVDGLPEMFKMLCDECFNCLKEIYGKELIEIFEKAEELDMIKSRRTTIW